MRKVLFVICCLLFVVQGVSYGRDCQVGDIIRPGESCEYGIGETEVVFSVDANGAGCRSGSPAFVVVFGIVVDELDRLDDFCTVREIERDEAFQTNFSASPNGDRTWTINSVPQPRATVTITGPPGTARGAFEVIVRFSQPVTGFSRDDISVGNGSVSLFTGSGTTYSAIITPTAGFDGTVTVNVAANVAQDADGNGNEAATPYSRQAVAPDNHGNTRGGATRINANSTTAGVLSRGDTDYFRVAVNGAGTLTASTRGNVDTYGYIEDSTGAVLGSHDGHILHQGERLQ